MFITGFRFGSSGKNILESQYETILCLYGVIWGGAPAVDSSTVDVPHSDSLNLYHFVKYVGAISVNLISYFVYFSK